MSAPRDMLVAEARLQQIVTHPLSGMPAGDLSDLREVHALLVSLIERCRFAERERAAIVTLAHATTGDAR